MKTGLENFCNGLLAAQFNGLYQGILLVVAVSILLKLMPRSNAATRHGVLLVTLAVVALLPIVHFGIANANIFQTALLGRFGDESPAVTENSIDSADAENVDNTQRDEPAEVDSTESSTQAEVLPPSVTADADRFSFSTLVPRISLRSSLSIEIVAGWLLLSFFLLVRLARQLLILRKWKRSGHPISANLRLTFEELCAELNVKRCAGLVVTDQPVPLAAGFQHPAVLLPSSILATANDSQVRQILRHEVAHLARRDDWANLGQQLAKSIWFFHPAVWFLNRELSLQREIACDDHVLAASGSPRSYALFLTEFASRPYRRQLTAVTAAWSNHSQLKQRIHMILNAHRNTSPRLARARAGLLTAATALVALLALRAGPRVLFASEPVAPPTAETSVTTQTSNETSTSADEPVIANSEKTITIVRNDSAVPEAIERAQKDEYQISSRGTAIASITTGPKIKSSSSALTAPEVNVQVSSRPALPSLSLTAPPTPRLLASNSDLVDPPQRPERPHRKRDESVEARLDRLEAMIESLVDHEKGKREIVIRNKTPQGEAHAQISKEELDRIKDQARAEAERAGRDAERAMKQAQKAMAEAHANFNTDFKWEGLDKAQFDGQRRALEMQRQALQQQMKALEKQLAHLDKEKEKQEKSREKLEKGDGHGDNADARSNRHGEDEKNDDGEKRKAR